MATAKRHYHDVARSSSGGVIGSPTVTVYEAGTTTVSTIFSDGSGTAKSNPFTGGSDGFFEFYVDPGDYKIRVERTGFEAFEVDNEEIGYDYTELGNVPFSDVRTSGAVGDGVTDDTAAIQAALDALAASGGGFLFFPAGQYNISAQIDVPSDIVLMGSGYASRIHMLTADTQMFQVAGEANAGFAQLRLSGQGGFTTPGSGAIRLGLGSVGNGATDCWVRDCWITGVSNCGVTIGSQSLRCRVINTLVDGAGEENIYLLGQQCSIVGCTSLNAAQGGIKVSAAAHFVIQGNVIRSSGLQGILLTGSPGARFGVVSGNSIYGAGDSGIRVADSAADIAIVGNVVTASSQTSDAARQSIEINGASVARIFVSGNACRVGPETNGPAYGLRLSAGSDCVVGDNDLSSGGKTGQYLDSATNTQGTHLKARVAPASGNTTLTSATDTDIAGCSITVTPLLTQVVTIYAVVDLSRVTADTLTIDLDVNGTDEPNPIVMADSARQPVFGVWVLTLVGGTAYTIKLQGSLQAGTGEWTVQSAGTKLVLAPGGLA